MLFSFIHSVINSIYRHDNLMSHAYRLIMRSTESFFSIPPYLLFALCHPARPHVSPALDRVIWHSQCFLSFFVLRFENSSYLLWCFWQLFFSDMPISSFACTYYLLLMRQLDDLSESKIKTKGSLAISILSLKR